ncbi:hypothetical protein QA542_05815 [Staphylococcus saprophyticus]|nr:hypothetical protein QA542_05815 [Staphylococcus saprophyticus]
MTRKTTFLKAIDQLYETAHLLNQYENIPRNMVQMMNCIWSKHI